MRQYRGTQNMFSEFTTTKASLLIVIIICAVEVLNAVFNNWIFDNGIYFSKESAQFWRVFTAPWINGGFANLIGMLCILVFFAPQLEKRLGWFHFGIMIVIGGLIPSITALFFTFLTDESFLFFGSMGMGLTIFTGMFLKLEERQVQLLFFPNPMRLKYVVLGFAIIWFMMELNNSRHTGDIRYLFQLTAIPFSLFYLKFVFVFGKRKIKKKSKARKYQKKIRPRTTIDLAREKDSEVDKILDKISANGFQSLSDQERKVLDKASKSND